MFCAHSISSSEKFAALARLHYEIEVSICVTQVTPDAHDLTPTGLATT